LGGGVDYDIEHCHLLSYFLSNLQLNIGKKYLRTAKIIDESLILPIVLRIYSTKPSYIFQLKRELKVPLQNAYPKQESEVSTFVFACFDFS
jgi:hypothetical protein